MQEQKALDASILFSCPYHGLSGNTNIPKACLTPQPRIPSIGAGKESLWSIVTAVLRHSERTFAEIRLSEHFVDEVKGFLERKDKELSRKILWDNPKRLYGI
jgi:hypothetical protein